MRLLQLSITSGFAIALSACAPMPRVALEATPADVEMLAGEWRGEYESAALGRRGRIAFKLDAHSEEAYGSVTLVPAGKRTSYSPETYDDYEENNAHQGSAGLLTIKFIRADDGSIVGMLDRYWDPDRQCYAISVFRGHIGRGIVEGTFLTTFGSGAGEATGTWHASKQPPSRR